MHQPSFSPSCEAIVENLRAHPDGLPRLIAIDGGGAAGKSTLAGLLARALPGCHVVAVDDLYLPSDTPNDTWNCYFDVQRLIHDVLEPASNHQPLRYQRYNWKAGHLDDWMTVDGYQTLIVEGVNSLHPEARHYYDYSIWLECPAEERLTRGIARDGHHHRHTWQDVWLPADEAYRQTHQPHLAANLIVLTGECA